MISLADIMKASEYAHYRNLRYGLLEQNQPQSDEQTEPEIVQDLDTYYVVKYKNKKVQEKYDQFLQELSKLNSLLKNNGIKPIRIPLPDKSILGRDIQVRDYEKLIRTVKQYYKQDEEKINYAKQWLDFFKNKQLQPTRLVYKQNEPSSEVIDLNTVTPGQLLYTDTGRIIFDYAKDKQIITISEWYRFYKDYSIKFYTGTGGVLAPFSDQFKKTWKKSWEEGGIDWARMYEIYEESLIQLAETAEILTLFIPYYGPYISSGVGFTLVMMLWNAGRKEEAVVHCIFTLIFASAWYLQIDKLISKAVAKSALKVATPQVIKTLYRWMASGEKMYLEAAQSYAKVGGKAVEAALNTLLTIIKAIGNMLRSVIQGTLTAFAKVSAQNWIKTGAEAAFMGINNTVKTLVKSRVFNWITTANMERLATWMFKELYINMQTGYFVIQLGRLVTSTWWSRYLTLIAFTAYYWERIIDWIQLGSDVSAKVHQFDNPDSNDEKWNELESIILKNQDSLAVASNAYAALYVKNLAASSEPGQEGNSNEETGEWEEDVLFVGYSNKEVAYDAADEFVNYVSNKDTLNLSSDLLDLLKAANEYNASQETSDTDPLDQVDQDAQAHETAEQEKASQEWDNIKNIRNKQDKIQKAVEKARISKIAGKQVNEIFFNNKNILKEYLLI